MNQPNSAATLPSHASVVVIGGGIMGCSTLYHLAKSRCRRCRSTRAQQAHIGHHLALRGAGSRAAFDPQSHRPDSILG
eukprot:UN18124